MKSRSVRVWSIKVNSGGSGRKRRKSYTVRWTVSGRERSRTFVSRALADSYRSDLLQAVNRGEAFEIENGLPESMAETQDVKTWLDFCLSYVDMKWPSAAAKTRDGITDALGTVTPALVRDTAGRPATELLRRALRTHLLPPATRTHQVSPDITAAARWLERASLPLTALSEPATTRSALDALALQLDGQAAAATTTRRRRAVFYNVLQYAVELEMFPANPVDRLRVRTARHRVAETVDPRVVVSQRQARELLVAVTYVGRRGQDRRGERLRAFYGCMYLAALRPAEALGLRFGDCALPDAGWGAVTLTASRPSAGKRYTDSGEVHDIRGLKHRAASEPRRVPVPPQLVAMLRQHIDRFGVAEDGRLFRSERGNPVGSSTYFRVWDEARHLALPPTKADSPLARRPYDLRHAAVSLWLNAGVPATEVAERAGHSVDVLLKRYAKCIDGQAAIINRRIDGVLDGFDWAP
jgi:integrase